MLKNNFSRKFYFQKLMLKVEALSLLLYNHKKIYDIYSNYRLFHENYLQSYHNMSNTIHAIENINSLILINHIYIYHYSNFCIYLISELARFYGSPSIVNFDYGIARSKG